MGHLDDLMRSLDKQPEEPTDPLNEQRETCKQLAKRYGMEYVDLRETQIDPEVLALLPAKIIKKYNVLPIENLKTEIKVVFSDPENLEAVADVEIYLEQQHSALVQQCLCYAPDAEEKVRSLFISTQSEIDKLMHEAAAEAGRSREGTPRII